MLKYLLKEMRVHHYVKNLLVFAALVCSGKLFDSEKLMPATLIFAAFCFTSSIVYMINDIKDVEKDRNHPTKCKRPIAAGNISIRLSVTMKRIGKSGRIHGKAGGWCRTAIRRLSAGNCFMKFPHYGKPSKRLGRNEKSGADSAERTIRTSSKAESFAKSAEKNWFVIGKVMVRCIFTVHLAMFPSQRKTSGTALTRSCTNGWKNTVICRSWYGKALEKANSNQKK